MAQSRTFTAKEANGVCPHCKRPVPELPCEDHPRYGWQAVKLTMPDNDKTDVLYACKAKEKPC